MNKLLGALARQFLLRIDPESAHGLAIAALRALPGAPARPGDPLLALEAFGLKFPNPLGMAAGFDKNAEAARGLLNAGFGFVELGTLTPHAQSGNPRPRIFRLGADGGLVNRLGFNNDGYEAALARLRAARPVGVVGINIGPNKDAVDRIADYVRGVKAFSGVASYLTVNVSSPNTPGLRDLQGRENLDALVARVLEARDSCETRRPVLLKIAPDLTSWELDDAVGVARARGVDGLIVGNTTLSRPASLKSFAAGEAGGLSGRPLFSLSTQRLAQAYLRAEGAFPLIGCGGVDGAEALVAKLEAGATLAQIYTALIYRGPALIDEILAGLARILRARGLRSVAQLTGTRAKDWAAEA